MAQRLHCQVLGSGPPLLLIHGLGASWRDWREVMPLLASRWRVIAPDLRGFGASPPGPGGYHPEALAEDVLATMQGLGVARAPVVGHSMGGAVAMSLALAAPQRVAALVLCNTVPSFQPQRLRDRMEFALRSLTMALLGPRRLGRIMGRRMFPEPGQQALREMIEARAAGNHRGVYLRCLRALQRWSVEAELPRLRMPTLVVASGQDYFPVEEVRRFAESLPDGAFHCFAHARHGLPLEEGAALAARIAAFLEPFLDPFLEERAPGERRTAGGVDPEAAAKALSAS